MSPKARPAPRDLWPLVALAAALAACGKEIESQQVSAGEATPSRVTTVSSAADEETRLRANLYSERDADVYCRVREEETGGVLVKAIYVEIGDHVQAGQLLSMLEEDEAAVELEAARARVDEARARFGRTQELRDGGFVSASEYDAALSGRRSAEAALQRAELELARTRVRAPFAGIVARRYVRVGERVEEGAPLFRVTAPAPLRARLLVPEQQGSAYRPGSAVRLTGMSGEVATAHVILIGPTIDPGSGTQEVIVELQERGSFLPGAAVTAEPIDLRAHAER